MKINDVPTITPHPGKALAANPANKPPHVQPTHADLAPQKPEKAPKVAPPAVRVDIDATAHPRTGKKLVVVKDPIPPEAVEGSGRTHTEHPLAKMLVNTDARAMSPREVTNLSFELYAAGVLRFDEHADLAYQPELDPGFNKTIGALTGEVARPDTKRDQIKDWEQRYDFLSRHRSGNSRSAERALHILGVLRRIESPTDVEA